MRPNGQIPAYEWAFGDVNPPVQAWAAWRVYQIDRKQNGGSGDLEFLERVFHKLMLNFTWWVNRKDQLGRMCSRAVFSGWTISGSSTAAHSCRPAGISISPTAPLDGDVRPQPHAHCARTRRTQPRVRGHRQQVFEHFLSIAEAMACMYGGEFGLWDEQDQFYYDVLNLRTMNASACGFGPWWA